MLVQPPNDPDPLTLELAESASRSRDRCLGEKMVVVHEGAMGGGVCVYKGGLSVSKSALLYPADEVL